MSLFRDFVSRPYKGAAQQTGYAGIPTDRELFIPDIFLDLTLLQMAKSVIEPVALSGTKFARLHGTQSKVTHSKSKEWRE